MPQLGGQAGKTTMNMRRMIFVFGVLAAQPLAMAGDLDPSGTWSAYNHGAAVTPPMGWSSWNTFATDITEDKVLGVGKALVDSGLAAKGYRYVNMDDGWWAKRRASDGRMQIRTEAFPSAAVGGADQTSFKPFTDKLHAMGLKAGIYTDLGRNSCSQAWPDAHTKLPQGTQAEREIGLYGHTDQDIKLYFQDWGFDYIKVDACGVRDYAPAMERVTSGQFRATGPYINGWQINGTDIAGVRGLYQGVADALARYRPKDDFIFSICVWGAADVRAWGKDVGSLSRTSDDLQPRWTRMLADFDTAAFRPLYAHPHSWNDPDMLYIGYGDFDENHLTEARSHFSLWAIINAPLILGNDIRTMPKALRDIVGNPDIIALNQDAAGNQATLAYDASDVQIFVKTLASGKKAVAIFNRGIAAMDVDLTAQQLKLADDGQITLTDLWSKAQTHFTKETKLSVAPRQTLVFLADGPRRLKNGLYLSEMPGRVNPAVDGVKIPQADPLLYRSQAWGGTHGNGAHPQYAGWGGAQADLTPFGQALSIGGKPYDSGLGVLANSRLEVRNNGSTTFTAEVGVDDSTPDTSQATTFAVYGDGKLLARSAAKRYGEKPEVIRVGVKGIKIIELIATNGAAAKDQPTLATWGNAALTR
jgi:alpha-galactosidase